MKYKNTLVLEPNELVTKYKDDLFRKYFVDLSKVLDDETLREHRRQVRRIEPIWSTSRNSY